MELIRKDVYMAKFCRNCGAELPENAFVCVKCGVQVNNPNINQNVNQASNGNMNNTSVGKSKVAAGLFGIFLGCFGVHNFYLGYTGKAVAQLLISLLSCFILSPVSAIWGLIEGIMILSGSINKDANGNSLVD